MYKYVIYRDGVEYWVSAFAFSSVEMLEMLVSKYPDNQYHLRCIPLDD